MSLPDDPLAQALDAPIEAPRFADEGDPGPDTDGYDEAPFPHGSPVQPLGISANIEGSQKCFYLDVNGMIVGLEAGNKHGKNSMIALYGDKAKWLEVNFPQWSAPQYEGRGKERHLVKESEIIGFDQAEASRALIIECARKGMFDPAGRLRGRGAHQLPNGGLVVHHGDKLLHSLHKADGTIKDWDWSDCGLHGRFVYPAGEATPRPWPNAVDARPVEKLLAFFGTWQWERPKLDPRFLLGWIGSAMVGGALKWRPNVWLTGGAGTGKSTLNGEGGAIDLLFGNAVMRTGNASAAAIRQTLKNSTIPVMLDEIEASADNRRVTEVVELARVSSSGGTMHRGGSDHQAHEFTLRSCFQFSSVLIPPLEPTDRSRLGILELRPFPPGTEEPILSKMGLPDVGRQLQRRMIDGWHRFDETLSRFKSALSARGHSRRACDQFGALLACADILINELIPDDEEVNFWAGLCAPDRMSEISESAAEHEMCLQQLITWQVQARGGDEREALGTWIGKAINAAQAPLLADHANPDRSAERLQQIGLKLVNPVYYPEELNTAGDVVKAARWGATQFVSGVPGYLAVANSHQGLSPVFAGTKWQGGVWRQSLGRAPGALQSELKFGKIKARAVLVPLSEVLHDDELPSASKPEAVAEWIAAQQKGVGS